MSITGSIRNTVSKVVGQGKGLPTGIDFTNKNRFMALGTGVGAATGAVGGAAIGAASNSEDRWGGALKGGLIGAAGGAALGAAGAHIAHGRAIQTHGQRLNHGNQQTTWSQVRKRDAGPVQEGSQAAQAKTLRDKYRMDRDPTPREAYNMQQFENAQKTVQGQTFKSSDEFRKWVRSQARENHPDILRARGASAQEIAAAEERLRHITSLQADLTSGKYTPEQMGWGQWKFSSADLYHLYLMATESPLGTRQSYKSAAAEYSVDPRLLVRSPDGNPEIVDLLTMFKKAALAMPSVPTPQFPLGLAKVTPKSVSSAPLKATATAGTTKATNFTQVHSQPSVVNQSAYSGAKSVPAPSVKR